MENDSYKLAIIGTKDQILGFTALGMMVVAVNNFEEAREKILKLALSNVEGNGGETRREYAIIFIMEEYAERLTKDDYKKINKEALPAVIPIPGIKGTSGHGLARVKKMVEQAVGSDIFG